MRPNRASGGGAVRFLIGNVSLFVVTLITVLAAWVFIPRIAVGWTPVAITSGSMGPAIERGDVILAGPQDGLGLAPGTVVVFDDPSRPGYATHRIAGTADDGSYITKGDANSQRDSTPLRPEDVVGTGRLLIPLVGFPAVWYSERAWLELALAVVLFGAATRCTRWAFASDPWRRVSADGRPESHDHRRRRPVVGFPFLSMVSVVILTAVGLPQPSSAAFTSQALNEGNNLAADVSFLNETFRVTTYEIGSSVFTGTTYTLTLDRDLATDYFVILRGGAGASDSATHRTPDQNYARVDGDPHANFATVTAANQLRLSRQAASSAWQGQITVVEATADQATSGFTLLDVVEVSLASGVTSASGSSAVAWSDINQVGLYGGIRGGGVATTTNARNDHMTAWALISPSAGSTVGVRRMAGGGGALSGDTTFTVYVVEWGSEWTIQRAAVSGTAGGNGANLVGHYDTASIAPVVRDNSFVLAYGVSADNGLGDGWEGQVFTLGDGVSQLAVETLVAVGGEYTDARNAAVYVHTHPSLGVDYRFGSDGGTPGIPTASLSGVVAIDPARGAETYDNVSPVRKTAGFRLSVMTNTSNGTGTAYPRAMVWSRPTDPTTATWARSRSGQPGALWLQSVDFSSIAY